MTCGNCPHALHTGWCPARPHGTPCSCYAGPSRPPASPEDGLEDTLARTLTAVLCAALAWVFVAASGAPSWVASAVSILVYWQVRGPLK